MKNGKELLDRWRVVAKKPDGELVTIGEFLDVRGAQKELETVERSGVFADVSVFQLNKEQVRHNKPPAPPSVETVATVVAEPPLSEVVVVDETARRQQEKTVARALKPTRIFTFDEKKRLVRFLRDSRREFYRLGTERIAFRVMADCPDINAFDPMNDPKRGEAECEADWNFAERCVKQQFPDIRPGDLAHFDFEFLVSVVWVLAQVIDGKQVVIDHDGGWINAEEKEDYEARIREEEEERAIERFEEALAEQRDKLTAAIQNEHHWALRSLQTVKEFMAKGREDEP